MTIAEAPAAPPWKALREATGLKQIEVERRCGWKRGHLSWIERGIAPSPEQRRVLLRVLKEALEAAGVFDEVPA